MNKIRYVSSKKRYYVRTGKVHKTDVGSRNFQVCYNLKHALAVYRRCKVDIRQIDVRIWGKQPYALRWGRK